MSTQTLCTITSQGQRNKLCFQFVFPDLQTKKSKTNENTSFPGNTIFYTPAGPLEILEKVKNWKVKKNEALC